MNGAMTHPTRLAISWAIDHVTDELLEKAVVCDVGTKGAANPGIAIWRLPPDPLSGDPLFFVYQKMATGPQLGVFRRCDIMYAKEHAVASFPLIMFWVRTQESTVALVGPTIDFVVHVEPTPGASDADVLENAKMHREKVLRFLDTGSAPCYSVGVTSVVMLKGLLAEHREERAARRARK